MTAYGSPQNPYALHAYPQVNGNYPTIAPSGMMGRGQPWPEERLQPTFQASPGAIGNANAMGGIPAGVPRPQQPAGSPGAQNPYALTAYAPQSAPQQNPALTAISGTMMPTGSPTTSVSSKMGFNPLFGRLGGSMLSPFSGKLQLPQSGGSGGLMALLQGIFGSPKAGNLGGVPRFANAQTPSQSYADRNSFSAMQAIENSRLSQAAKARAMQGGLTSQGNPGWWDRGSGGGGYNGTGGNGSLL